MTEQQRGPEARMREAQRAWFDLELARLQHRGWYGSITLRLEAGCIKGFKREESVLPPADLR